MRCTNEEDLDVCGLPPPTACGAASLLPERHLTQLQALDTLPPGILLMTLDVKSLYTNIPHADGIEACREVLNTRTQSQPPTEDLVEITQQILTKNTFTFAGQHYLQTHGTAMGTRMAPSYANLFMLYVHQPPARQKTLSTSSSAGSAENSMSVRLRMPYTSASTATDWTLEQRRPKNR